MIDERLKALEAWSRGSGLGADSELGQLVPVSDDASFQRYFRYTKGAPGWVFVDAPPEFEDNPSFVAIAKALSNAGLSCPKVYRHDFDQGFMVISDLGNDLYQEIVEADPGSCNALYDDAVAALLTMIDVAAPVPDYTDEKLREELALFDRWFLGGQLGLEADPGTRAMLGRL